MMNQTVVLFAMDHQVPVRVTGHAGPWQIASVDTHRALIHRRGEDTTVTVALDALAPIPLAPSEARRHINRMRSLTADRRDYAGILTSVGLARIGSLIAWHAAMLTVAGQPTPWEI
jgi:hypothetical protein